MYTFGLSERLNEEKGTLGAQNGRAKSKQKRAAPLQQAEQKSEKRATFKNGMTKGRSGKLVASCSLEWNSSMVSVEFCKGEETASGQQRQLGFCPQSALCCPGLTAGLARCGGGKGEGLQSKGGVAGGVLLQRGGKELPFLAFCLPLRDERATRSPLFTQPHFPWYAW